MQNLVRDGNRRILVIDDNPSIHSDFRKVLIPDKAGKRLEDAEAAFFDETYDPTPQLDFELDSAQQGQVGLEKVRAAVEQNRPYALAFVDMRMPPGWDGLTTIEQLWKVAPDLQVVICSAYSDNSWSDICRRLGSTDRLLILKKPFDSAEVCQLAMALTEKWNVTRQARLKQADLERLVDERTAQLRRQEAALWQKQKLEALGSLAGGVAHEINNLLHVILGYTRIAMDELPTNEQPHNDLTNVVEAVDLAADITSQLLNFSRQKSAQKSVQELNSIVAHALKLIRPVCSKQIELDIDLDTEAGRVRADVDVISQVLLNLCINANDAMPSGGRLQVTSRQVVIQDRRGRNTSLQHPNLEPGKYSVITVADTGVGMPTDVIDRIFDPFFTTKDVGKGTGLGLSMVLGAIHDHDGIVTAESDAGQGSKFRIFLPAVPEDALDAATIESGSDESTLTGNEPTLLAEANCQALVCEVTAHSIPSMA